MQRGCTPGQGSTATGANYESEEAWQAWEEEMRGYGYTQEEIDEMKAGGGGEDRGAAEIKSRVLDANAVWERELKRIFVLKRIQGADSLEDDQSEDKNEADGRMSGRDRKKLKPSEKTQHAQTRAENGAKSIPDSTRRAAAQIARENFSTLSCERFWDEYMVPNVPVVVQHFVQNAEKEEVEGPLKKGGTGGKRPTKGWRVWREWVTPDGEVDMQYLFQHFGTARVTVHNCARKTLGLNTCAKKEMLLADFVQWWQGPIGTRVRTRGAALAARHGIVVCDAVDNVSAGGTLEEVRDDRERGEGAGEDEEEEVYYLKDWNFTKEYPEYGLYPRPDLFAEDWLNWYQRNSATDHRFVYLGPAGSVTPLHTDTLDSFSWSANIAGYKRWHLLPPSSTHALHTGSGTQLLDVRFVDGEAFPDFEAEASAKMIEFVQAPGEIVFVPSGWWHQVENLTDALSVNHNWLNGANIHSSWALLQAQRDKIAAEMPLEREEAVFQEVLEFRLGWNYESFYTLLAESLAVELRRSQETLQRAPGRAGGEGGREGQGVGQGEGGCGAKTVTGSWLSEVRLRLLGLKRLKKILADVQQTVAGRQAALGPPPGMRRLDQLLAALEANLAPEPLELEEP